MILFVLFVVVEVEIEISEKHGHVFLEVVERAAFLLRGAPSTSCTVDKAADFAHFQQFVLFRACDVLEDFGDEFSAHAVFDGLQDSEGISDGGLLDVNNVAHSHHAGGLELVAAKAHLAFLACCRCEGACLEDACCPQPFVNACFVVHDCEAVIRQMFTIVIVAFSMLCMGTNS